MQGMRVSSFLRVGSKTLDLMEHLFGPTALRSYLAEFISTFLFVFAAVASSISLGKLGESDPQSVETALVAVAIAHAFAFTVAVYVGSSFSGGHANPSVTFSFVVGGHISILTGLCYFVAQILGSTLACLLLMLLTTGQAIPTHGPAEEVSRFGATAMEAIATFAVVYTFHVARDLLKGSDGVIGPIAVGFVVGANILAIGSYTGGSMNPARSFGPAMTTGDFTSHWVYWLGPMTGGAVAGLVYQRIMAPRNSSQISLASESV